MNDSERSRKLAEMAFGTSMGKGSDTSDATPAPVSIKPSDDKIERLIADFEAAAQVDDEGVEYWFARDIQALLGYTKWDNFLGVVERAKEACAQAGHGLTCSPKLYQS